MVDPRFHVNMLKSFTRTTKALSHSIRYTARMHSSRMRTARSSSTSRGVSTAPWEQTPQALVPPGSRSPWGRQPPEQALPWEQTPQARPLNFPFGCGPGGPHGQTLSTPPLGVGTGNLQGMLGYYSPRPAARHAGIPPPMDRQTWVKT